MALTRRLAASDVWADTAYRSQANEEYLERHGKKSRIHHKKPKGKPMPKAVASSNAAKSKIRAHVEHVFATQKDRMGLFVRTVASQSTDFADVCRRRPDAPPNLPTRGRLGAWSASGPREAPEAV